MLMLASPFFWLCWVFIPVWPFSSCSEYTAHCNGLSLWSTGSRMPGLQ